MSNQNAPRLLGRDRHLELGLGLLLAALPSCGQDPADQGPPTVEILSPLPEALLPSEQIAVKVRVRDDRAVKSATITVGDRQLPIDLAQLDALGEGTVHVVAAEGRNRIVVTAADASGGSASGAVEVRVDATAPALRVLAPLADFSETRRLLRVAVTDNTGIAAISYAVNDGAQVAVPAASGQTQLDVAEALTLRPGANTLTLQATDTAGHTHQEKISFRYGQTTTGGGAHSGAVVKGRLLVWGRNNVGQLGLGDPVGDDTSRLAPAAAADFGGAGSEVAAVAFNQNHSLAIRSDGTVWTWGANTDGQLGHGDTLQRTLPTQLAGVTDAVYGVLGYSHSLLLRADGTVMAWGKNGSGQIGVPGAGTTTDRQPAPVAVMGLPTGVVKIIAGSEHSAALRADGTVYTWGRNSYGNLGTGTVDTDRHPSPMPVPGLTDVIDIATGRDHLIALRADGSVWSWGLGSSGQLGYGENSDPNGENRATPVPVVRDANALRVADGQALFANGNTSYLLTRDGKYWGWGQNFSGQLATGQTTSQEWFAVRTALYTAGEKPVFLDEVVPFGAIGSGALHTIVQGRDGSVYAWGWNFRGSLGVPTLANAWAQTSPLLLQLPQ